DRKSVVCEEVADDNRGSPVTGGNYTPTPEPPLEILDNNNKSSQCEDGTSVSESIIYSPIAEPNSANDKPGLQESSRTKQEAVSGPTEKITASISSQDLAAKLKVETHINNS